MKRFKRRAVLALTTTAVLAGSVVMSGPANAASSPIAACGSGYHEIDHHDLGSIATIYLLYNGSTDCVVTWKKAPYAGTRSLVEAGIQIKSSVSDQIYDEGNYLYYAGPVKVKAPGVCIGWGGAADPGWVGWWSGWTHCG